MMSSCDDTSSLPKLIQKGSNHTNSEAFKETCYQRLYDAGPAGWMMEIWDPSQWDLSVYVFCQNHKCNLADDGQEFNGIWKLEEDSVRIEFYEVISHDGIVTPFNWKQDLKALEKNKKKNEAKIAEMFIPKETFSWTAMVESAANGNKYPFKLISLAADCE